MTPEFLTAGDYPSEQTLKQITDWPHEDFTGLIDFISPYFSRYGRIWERTDSTQPNVLKMATGGWSGNEDIIEAMQENHMLWSTKGLSSNSGGLFTFEI